MVTIASLCCAVWLAGLPVALVSAPAPAPGPATAPAPASAPQTAAPAAMSPASSADAAKIQRQERVVQGDRPIEPVHLYNGIRTPMVVRLELPSGLAAAALLLLEPVSGKVVERAALDKLSTYTDLYQLFPTLRSTTAPRVLHAQLAIRRGDAPADSAEERIGPAVVLQPMLAPRRASLDRRTQPRPSVVFEPDSPKRLASFSGYRAYVNCHIELATEVGQLVFALRPDAAPNTAWNFRHLAEGGFFDGTDFFRTVPVGSQTAKGFVVQGGDPTLAEPYDGGPGYDIALEPSTLAHDYGVISMARDTEPDTAGSQFFICLSREETARLDGQYAAFGQLLATPPSRAEPWSKTPASGETLGPVEVLTRIASGPLKAGQADRPVKPIKILRATLIDAPPTGMGPSVLRLDGNRPGAR